jgi:hypothetical protein
MAFKITYFDPDKSPESVEAENYTQEGEWFVFTNYVSVADSLGGSNETVLRLRAAERPA